MTLAAWLGLASPPGQSVDHRPAVLLEGTSRQLEADWPVVDAALRNRSGYRLIIAVPSHEVNSVRQRFSHEQVVAMPYRARRGEIALVIKAGGNAEAIPERIAALPESPQTSAPAASTLASVLLPLMGIRQFDTAVAVREALGQPHTIICLGNGPTSGAPALDDHPPATLFRVNWIWRNQTRLNRPHMVFTADPDVPPAGLDAILAFPDSTSGRAIVAQHLLALRPPRAGYIFADRFTPPFAVSKNSLRPTNGAMMVAFAAALRPRKLIIGGIDLYSHPEGRYPQSPAIDGYARGHNAGCDLIQIKSALSDFTGDVEHLNPHLRAALEAISDRS